MADKKIYCGNGRKIITENGVFRSLSICLDDIPEEHIAKSAKNGKRYVKLTISDMQQPNDFGNDVYATVNTWKPNTEQSHQARPQNDTETKMDQVQTEDGDLPF